MDRWIYDGWWMMDGCRIALCLPLLINPSIVSALTGCKLIIVMFWCFIDLRNQLCHLTRPVSCGLLSSSLLRVFCGSTGPALFSLPLLPVEAESGPWRSSSHTVSSVSEVGREPILGLRRSTSAGFTLMETPPSSCFQKVPKQNTQIPLKSDTTQHSRHLNACNPQKNIF